MTAKSSNGRERPGLFQERVYALVRRIPPGMVATYGDIAAWTGNARAARAVGAAMRHNPDASTIPCHRVVGSDGRLHGYAFGGAEAKQARLLKEGVRFEQGRVVLAACRWQGPTP